MKTMASAGVVALLLTACTASRPDAYKTTITSFDRPVGRAGEKVADVGSIRFVDADLAQVFALYQDLCGRTLVRSPQVPLNVKFTLENKTPLTRVEALQILDTALAQNGIVMAYSGETAVRAIPAALASQEAGPVIDLPRDQLPDSKSFMVRVVHPKHRKPQELVGMISPFASLPNSLIAVHAANTLYLRDYSSNIRQMLRVIEDADRQP